MCLSYLITSADKLKTHQQTFIQFEPTPPLPQPPPLTWNILRRERQWTEGGARLLSISTVRPFSLAAGLMRTDRAQG